MNSENNNNGTPRLRFPSFTEQWEEKPLSYFLHEHKTKSDGKCEVHSVSVTKGVINQVEYLGRSFAASDTSKYKLAKPNDIIYTKSPTGAFPYGIIKQNKNPYNVIVSPLYAVYSPINEHIGYILDSFFESPVNTNNYLSSLVQKGAKNTIQITNDKFISKSVCFPLDPAEQEKIAACLSAVDALIASQGLMVEALKERKRGLMQQLFPQQGETTPRLRFPGFTGEWEEKEFGKLIQESKLSSKEENEDVLLTSAIDGMFLNSERFSHQRGKSTIGYRKIKKGMLILSAQNLHLGNANVNLRFDSGLVSPAYKVYTIVGCLPEFMAQWIKRDATKEFFLRATTQGASECRKNVVWKQLYKQTIPVPNNDAEQRIIADFLSQMDAQIVAQSQKLEVLKAHKRGLMQQMFPNPNK